MSNVVKLYSANCFNVERSGPSTTGFEAREVAGKGYCVQFSHRKVNCDPVNRCHMMTDAAGSRVYRAGLGFETGKEGGFHTFKTINPHEEKSAFIKLETLVTTKPSQVIETLQRHLKIYEYGIYQGLSECIYGYEGYTTLGRVSAGQKFGCYFSDGFVRTFFYNGFNLVEVEMSPEDMVRSRIYVASVKIRVASRLNSQEEMAQQTRATVSQMLNTFFYLEDGELRKVLVDEFFLCLSKDLYKLFGYELGRVLHHVDRVLYGDLHPLTIASEVRQKCNVINIDTYCRKGARN